MGYDKRVRPNYGGEFLHAFTPRILLSHTSTRKNSPLLGYVVEVVYNSGLAQVCLYDQVGYLRFLYKELCMLGTEREKYYTMTSSNID